MLHAELYVDRFGTPFHCPLFSLQIDECQKYGHLVVLYLAKNWNVFFCQRSDQILTTNIAYIRLSMLLEDSYF